MPTDPATLLSETSCYQCDSSSKYSLELIIIGLLRQYVVNLIPLADTSPQAVLAASSCYSCYASNGYMLKLIEIGLLKIIAENTVLVEPCIISGLGDPVGLPPCPSSLYYDRTTENPGVWTWDSVLSKWENIIKGGP